MMEKMLFEKYEKYKEGTLQQRRFKQAAILPLIENLPFKKVVIGKSFEARDIIKVQVGSGKRNIMLWSQMHGNEASATMALFDIFNFFNSPNDEFDAFRKTICDTLSLHFIPMLNPDGAKRFTRRTAQGIDMNRDAVALQCPESRLLKTCIENFKPEFSFNLHDQNIRYSAGFSKNQATISFLATAYNETCDWNETRIKSRQVINSMNDVIQQFIPGGVGRFSDEFEPRAFGDNIQKWGSSLILIESGGYKNDIEKQFIRKLNFVAILAALYSIATEKYRHFTLDDYNNIPQNEKALFDLKIDHLKVNLNNATYEVSIGVNTEEKNTAQATSYTVSSVIEDMGDLSVFWGIEEFDAKGGVLKSFVEYPELAQKYNIVYPKTPRIDEEANFVIDHGTALTLVVNGKIIV